MLRVWTDNRRAGLRSREHRSLPAERRHGADAQRLDKLAPEIERYFKERAMHSDIGARLIAAWDDGIRNSLGVAGR